MEDQIKLSTLDLPFSNEFITNIIDLNEKGEKYVVDLSSLTGIDNAHQTLDYLSYCSVPFELKKDNTTMDLYLSKDLWFKQNNIVFDYFKSNQDRLLKLLEFLVNPIRTSFSEKKYGLESFTLSELSILEFDTYIINLIENEKIQVDKDAQIDALKRSIKRQKVMEHLLRGREFREISKYLPWEYLKSKEYSKYKDTLKKNIFSSSLPLGEAKRNTINLHLEVLDSCDQKCPGCFVKRRNQITENWISDIDNFLESSSFNDWNEVVVGPTDIFSATNFDSLFKDYDWSYRSLGRFSAITFNTTLNYPIEEIRKKFSLLKKTFPTKQLEFFIIVDIHQFLFEDESYMGWLKERMDILEDANIILTINTPEVIFWRYDAPGEIAFRRFNKNFKYTPSFFRSNNKSIISQYLKNMNEKSASGTNVINYAYDKNFGGSTYTTFVYKGGSMYWAPCVMDFVFVEDLKLKLKSLDDLNRLRFNESGGDCIDCPEKMSCSTRGVLTVKNHLKTQKCILPRDFKESLT